MSERPKFKRIVPSVPVFYMHCYDCGDRIHSREALADLNGPAFVAFYCGRCADDKVRQWDQDNGQFGVGA